MNRVASFVILGNANSCPRKVEPNSAPRVMARLCWKVIRPEPTSMASSVVVAEEDWLRMVTPNPVRYPRTLFLVRRNINLRRLSPAKAVMLLFIITIPKRNTASPPARSKIL
jgi:hypothetical protein